MLGVPLVSAGQLLGVLHVGRLDDRPFTDEDASLLQVVGDRVAAATQTAPAGGRARRGRRCWNAASCRRRCPACDGLEFAARYIPTERHMVGGDWYDVFTLPSGELWIVVGDVAGHGLAGRGGDGPHPQRAPRVRHARTPAPGGARARRPQGRPLRDRHHRDRRVRGRVPAVRPCRRSRSPATHRRSSRSPERERRGAPDARRPPARGGDHATPAIHRPWSSSPVPSWRSTPMGSSSVAASRSSTGSSACAPPSRSTSPNMSRARS